MSRLRWASDSLTGGETERQLWQDRQAGRQGQQEGDRREVWQAMTIINIIIIVGVDVALIPST